MSEPFRLLFCDDHRGVLDGLLREVAAPLGERVAAQAAASLEGVRALIDRHESFDVVVSDLNFDLTGGGPKDGLLILAAARAAWPQADLLLLTGYAGSLSFDEGLALATAGLATANVFRKAAQDDPALTWRLLRERIEGLLQARSGAAPQTGELLRERTFRRRRSLDETIRRVAGRALAEVAREIRADPECVAHGMVGQSFVLRDRLAAVERIARLQRTALILGETGTGKELVARALHEGSPRRGKPFVRTDLMAVTRELLASELFGHERGAFTGAIARRRGLFAEADGGTLFLDEIGNLPADAQPLLLRVLQERTFRPVGGTQEQKCDVFLISATNVDLEALARDGRFRADLLERLGVHRIELPPLRERREDIALLAAVTLADLRAKFGVAGFTRITEAALRLLVEEPWPRNVRQLLHALERLFGLLDGATDPIDVDHIRRVLPETSARTEVDAAAAKPLVRRVLDGEESLPLKELGRLYGHDALCEVIEQTLRHFRGPPDEETAGKLFGGMRSNTWRQFAYQRGYTWEKVRRGET